ncbi:MAG: RsmD family RNA methyltransferase [Planctomycetota bacterium]
MRIIGGELKRQRLETPPDAKTTRPMPDHVREAVFNILRGHAEGAHVFDAFAGTGSMGLEAVSRGAERVVLVERDKKIAKLLQRNVDHLDVAETCEVVVGDALGPGALARCPRPADLIFFDPPYPLVTEPGGWRRVRRQFESAVGRLADTGFALLRTPWPFFHELESERSSESSSEDEGPTSIVIGDEGELDDAALDAFEAALRGDAERAKPKRIEPDLTFETADGPETHVYGTTAVHLYMRRKDAAASA